MELGRKRKYLFDYDGVIVPDLTAEQLTRAYEKAGSLLSAVHKIPVEDAKVLLRRLREDKSSECKEPLIATLHRIVPELPVHAVFNAVFGSYKEDKHRFNYEKELALQFKDLRRRGVDSFVFTNNVEDDVVASMESKGIAPYFVDVVGCNYLNGIFKPAPEAFGLALKRMDAAPEEIVFIDNSVPNIKTAAETGIFSVHIHGDGLGKTRCEFADLIFTSVSEFLKLSQYLYSAAEHIRTQASPSRE